MSYSLPGYDAWLEAPYVDAARQADLEEKIIEELGLTDEEAADFDFAGYEADARADWEIEQAEAYADTDYPYDY